MGRVLAEYEGTKMGTYHTITRGKDGVVYCSCWAWKKNRTCKHLDRFFASAGAKGVNQQPVEVVPVQAPRDFNKPMKTAKDVMEAVDPTFWNVEKGSEDGVS